MKRDKEESLLDKKIIRKIDLSVKSAINIKEREYPNEDRNEVFILLFFLFIKNIYNFNNI